MFNRPTNDYNATFDAERLAEKVPLMRLLFKAMIILFSVFVIRDVILQQGVIGLVGAIRLVGVLILLAMFFASYRINESRLPALTMAFETVGSILVSILLTQRPEGPDHGYGGYMAAIIANAAVWSNRRQLINITVLLLIPLLIALIQADASLRAWINYGAFLGIAIFMSFVLLSQRTRIEISAQRMRIELEKRALSDGLTGVLNREGWNHYATIVVLECSDRKQPASLLFLDVDHFKQINDERGHAAGDQVLEGIATLLPSCVRSRDLIARLGGEEFVVLMPGAPLHVAAKVAERVRENVHKHFKTFTVTVSIGVAEQLPGESLENLQRRADQAMYRAKNNGRNRLEVA